MWSENVSEQAELASAGAFIDTTGEKERKRSKIQHAGAFAAEREEEELEALVLGKRSVFQPTESSGESESDGSDDEEEVVEGEDGGLRNREGDRPAWRDEDDDDMRFEY